MKIPTTIWVWKTHPHCHSLILNSPMFSHLWGSVSGGWFKCTMWGRTEDKQQAKIPRCSIKLHFFSHEHQSLKTSSSILLFFHQSITSASLFFWTHIHSTWQGKYWDNEFILAFVRAINGYTSIPTILWESTDGENQVEAVRCFHARVTFEIRFIQQNLLCWLPGSSYNQEIGETRLWAWSYHKVPQTKFNYAC